MPATLIVFVFESPVRDPTVSMVVKITERFLPGVHIFRLFFFSESNMIHLYFDVHPLSWY